MVKITEKERRTKAFGQFYIKINQSTAGEGLMQLTEHAFGIESLRFLTQQESHNRVILGKCLRFFQLF